MRVVRAPLGVILIALWCVLSVSGQEEPAAVEEQLADPVVRDFAELDAPSEGELAPLLQFVLPNGTTAIVFGQPCMPWEAVGNCPTHTAQTIRLIGRNVRALTSRFMGSLCTCRLESHNTRVACMCGEDSVDRVMDLFTPSAPVEEAEPAEEEVEPQLEVLVANVTENVTIDLPPVAEEVVPVPVPTSDFGDEPAPGSCDDECASTSFGNYTVCFAHCMVQQSRERKQGLVEHEARLEQQLDQVSRLLHVEPARALDPLANASAPVDPEVEVQSAETEAWRHELQRMHGRISEHLNHTQAEIVKSEDAEVYWMRVLGQYTEAEAAEQTRRVHLAERQLFKENDLAALREELLREKLAEVNSMLDRLQERYVEASGEVQANPEADAAAAAVLEAAAAARARLIARLHKQQEQLEGAQQMMAHSPSDKLQDMTTRMMRAVARTQADLARYSHEAAELAAMREQLYVTQSHLGNVTQYLVLLRMKDSNSSAVQQLEALEDRLSRDMHRLQGLIDDLTSTVPAGAPCSSDVDCGYAQLCDNGRCNTTLEGMPCEEGTRRWCGNGQQCVQEACRGVSNAISCSLDTECGVHQACISSRCRSLFRGLPVVAVPSRSACVDHLDCGPSQLCSDGQCRPQPAGSKCKTTAQCANGQACEMVEVDIPANPKLKTPSRRSNQTRCVEVLGDDTPCDEEDPACPAGARCVEGKCFALFGRAGGRCPPGTTLSAKRVNTCLHMVRGSPLYSSISMRMLAEGALRNNSGILEPASNFLTVCQRLQKDPSVAQAYAAELQVEEHVQQRAVARAVEAAHAVMGGVEMRDVAAGAVLLELDEHGEAEADEDAVDLASLAMWISAAEGVQAGAHRQVASAQDRSGQGHDVVPATTAQSNVRGPTLTSVSAEALGPLSALHAHNVPREDVLRFDGNGALVTIPGSELVLGNATVFIALRFQVPPAAGASRGGEGCLYSIGAESGAGPRMALRRDGAGRLVLDVEGRSLVSEPNVAATDGWLLIAQVRNGGRALLDEPEHALYVVSEGSQWREARVDLEAQAGGVLGISFDDKIHRAAAPVCTEKPCANVDALPARRMQGGAAIGACSAIAPLEAGAGLGADIVDFMVFDRVLPRAERRAVEAYLLTTRLARLVSSVAAAQERKRAHMTLTAYGDGIVRHSRFANASREHGTSVERLHWELQQVMALLGDARSGADEGGAQNAEDEEEAVRASLSGGDASPSTSTRAVDALLSDITVDALAEIRDKLTADLSRMTGRALGGDAAGMRFARMQTAAQRADMMADAAMALPEKSAMQLVEATTMCMCDTSAGQLAPENERCDVGELRSAVPEGTPCANMTLCGVAQLCSSTTEGGACSYVHEGSPCKSAADCGNAQRCTQGFCRPYPERSPCQRQSDCGNTQICYDNRCYGWYVGASLVADDMRPELWELELRKTMLVAEMEDRKRLSAMSLASQLRKLQGMRAELARQRANFDAWLAEYDQRVRKQLGSSVMRLEQRLKSVRSRMEDLERQQDALRSEREKRQRIALEGLEKERRMREQLERELQRLRDLKDGMELTGFEGPVLEKGEKGVEATAAKRLRRRSPGADEQWEQERAIGNARGGPVGSTSRFPLPDKVLPGELAKPGTTPADLKAAELDRKLLDACRHNATLAKALLDRERGRVEEERGKWEEAVVRLARPKTCHQLLGLATGGSSGVYTVFPPERGIAQHEYHGVRVFCDMNTDNGGWTLVSYAEDGRMKGALTTANGEFKPDKRAGSANVNALWLVQASTEMVVAWSKDYPGAPNTLPTAGISSYQYAVRFSIPNPAVQTLVPPPGAKTCNGGAFAPVRVQCLRGKCNMPSTMYTGTDSLGVCYGHAYGLVSGTGAKCDFDLNTDTKSALTRALYMSIDGTPGCAGIVDGTEARGQKNSVPTSMAIWVR